MARWPSRPCCGSPTHPTLPPPNPSCAAQSNCLRSLASPPAHRVIVTPDAHHVAPAWTDHPRLNRLTPRSADSTAHVPRRYYARPSLTARRDPGARDRRRCTASPRCRCRVNSALSPRLGRLLLWTNTEHAGRGPIHYCNRSRKRACGEALRVFLPHVQASAGPLRPCNEAVLCPIAPRAIGHECGAPVLVVPNPHSCLGIEPFTGSWPASDDAALG
jgi:hypothetical protein